MTFSADEKTRLLAVAPQPLADVFVVLMDTGMRPEEVYRLQWEGVQFEQNTIRVPYGKTGAARRKMGMSSRIRAEEQTASKKFVNTPWVFPSSRRKGGEITHITTVNKSFAITREEAGLPKGLVLYATRHTVGTDVMDATGNLKLTMKSMGHVDHRTCARYQHRARVRLRALSTLAMRKGKV